MKKIKTLILFLFLTVQFFAQDKTISEKNKTERDVVGTAHKSMIIPFEPKMYFSEIDRNINAETNMSAKEIRYKFRDGLNEQLYKAFKSANYNCVDLMEDTAKYKKEVEGIYQYLSYEYQKVPNQENYQAPKKEEKKQHLEKGQLNVETNSDQRFMNAKLTNPKTVPLLYGKYNTDIFVFVNQLDIRASGSKDPTELSMGTSKRKIVVHYTVYTADAKQINSGIAEEEFDVNLNNPKKIIDKHFSKIAETIVQRVNKGLATPSK